MNDQPKLSRDDPMPKPHATEAAPRRLPSGPRGFLTWPVEFEVEPWRP
jgi:hypothetical protein